MKKIAIIGAYYFQDQLILKAKEMGLETHVFAWEDGAVGKEHADFFYPISIIEKEQILTKCKEIGIDGICSIASDLAVLTVDYIAEKMNLNANSIECSEIATNKYMMRQAFKKNGDPIPKFIEVCENEDFDISKFSFPLIVKPTDRSGSRGITKVTDVTQLASAIKSACSESFEHKSMIEEFVEGKEYSVECISFHGKHTLLTITEKITTGAPHFIETGHNEPAPISSEMTDKIRNSVYHALNSLKIKEGASHSEIKIDDSNNIKIIEIGSRMGGDCIGSDLVRISKGYDFTPMVINVALCKEPDFTQVIQPRKAAVRFIFSEKDILN
ncbi:ATP-grasp domain-containing protein, partial [Methanosphaera sp.]|uniref:ATP-grasp domain-containing protein n=1 Tax=Methanosphaera sp. TaxID=2666342 RepID=UPI0025F0C27C